MKGDTILKNLKNTKNFIGVFARDQLPTKVEYPMGLIANTDSITEPGTHWISIYIDSNGIGEYFDPFGINPQYFEFEKFLYNNCPNGYFYNRITLQCLDCVTCGEYCEAYLITRLNGGSYADYISLFTSNPDKNDVLIKTYTNILFK
jgi:hypothetical protein